MSPWHILPVTASTHLVNCICTYLASRTGFHMSTAKFGGSFPRDLCPCGLLLLFGRLFCSHIHTVQTILVLSAAGPVFPSGTVLATWDVAVCLIEWAISSHLPTKLQWLPPCSQVSHCYSWSQKCEKDLTGTHLPFPNGETQSLLIKQQFHSPQVFLGYLFLHAGGLFGHRYTIKTNGQKTTVISVPNQYHW